MSANSILDVVIGLVFVFFVCSLAVSGINEFVRTILNTRAKALWASVNRMLDPSDGAVQSTRVTARLGAAPRRSDPTPQGASDEEPTLAQRLYDHPLIARLDPTWRNRPTRITHIAPTEFARALVDILTPDGDDGAKRWDAVGARITGLPAPLRAQFTVLYDEAEGSVVRFRESLEGWFDSGMRRVSEWYRRRTRIAMFCYGLVVAAAFNVSAVHLTTELYENDVVRQTVVQLATTRTTQDNLSNCTDRACVEDEIGALVDTGLPVFWRTCPVSDGDRRLCGFEDGRAIAGSIAGWVLTAAALSAGAAFWFALLKRAFQVRSSLGPRRGPGGG